MRYVSPYMHDIEDHPPTIQKKRLQVIFDFIGNHSFGKTLDIGTRNPLTGTLEEHFQIKIDSTNVDLDVGKLTGKYDTIFCLEVIEHLFNPLHLLTEIHNVLKDEGKVFLSTPKAKPHFLVADHHFHELHECEIRALAKRAGFKINRLEYHRIRPLSKCIGFRPMLRFFLERKTMMELQKI